MSSNGSTSYNRGEINWDGIPLRLQRRKRWAASRDETSSSDAGDILRRVAYQLPDDDGYEHRARSDDARTLTRFSEVRELIQSRPGNYSGPAFTPCEEDDFIVLDLDNVRARNGEIADWAIELMQSLPGYWEVSLSKTGLHGIVVAERLPTALCRGGFGCIRANLEGPYGGTAAKLEIYHARKFITLTGWKIGA